jgi:hypothetical protein
MLSQRGEASRHIRLNGCTQRAQREGEQGTYIYPLPPSYSHHQHIQMCASLHKGDTCWAGVDAHRQSTLCHHKLHCSISVACTYRGATSDLARRGGGGTYIARPSLPSGRNHHQHVQYIYPFLTKELPAIPLPCSPHPSHVS